MQNDALMQERLKQLMQEYQEIEHMLKERGEESAVEKIYKSLTKEQELDEHQ